MAALTLLMTALAVGGSPLTVARWQPLIAEAAQRCGVPEQWIARVMQAESGGRTLFDGVPIRSPKGAMGLMQLMPATWEEMRLQLGLGADPDDPHDNILAGACYLRRMADRFGYPGLFGAYNAGPERYAAWRAGRGALPQETIAYLAKLAPTPAAPAQSPGLFAVRVVAGAPASGSESAPQDPLFAIRRQSQ